MATVGNLSIAVSANTKALSAGLKTAESRVSSFSSTISSTLGAGLAGGAMFAGITTGLSAVKSGLQSVGGLLMQGVTAAFDAESTQLAFGTLLGSADKAKAVLADLSKFARETPFELPELTDAGKQLVAFGFEANDLVPNLRRIGDLAAGIGAPIGDLAYLFGTTRVQGRMMSADLNQFLNRGIPLIQEFAKQFGTSEAQVKELVSQGKIGYPELEKALISLTSTGGKFSGMMVDQSKSANGMIATMKDTFNTGLKEIAEDILQTFDFKAAIANVTVFTQDFIDTTRFAIRNAGTLWEMFKVDTAMTMIELGADIAAPLIAIPTVQLAMWKALFTNVKSGLIEIGNIATAVAVGIKDALSKAWDKNHVSDIAKDFADSFQKTLAEQQDAVSAGNPAQVWMQTFRDSMASTRDWVSDATSGLVEDRARLIRSLAASELANVTKTIDAASGSLSTFDPASGTSTSPGSQKQPTPGPAAFQQGSKEAFSAILGAMRSGAGGKPEENTAKNTAAAVTELKNVVRELRKSSRQGSVELVARTV